MPTTGGPWPQPWGAPHPAYPPMQPGPVGRTPSGLFPSRTSRPTYREPHPAPISAIMTGVAAGALWMLLFGLVGRDARSYCWWSIGAALAAWACSAFLARAGDRGIAIGVAISTSVGLTIAAAVVAAHWIGGNWLLW